jgi:hypothetical protein
LRFGSILSSISCSSCRHFLEWTEGENYGTSVEV